MKIDTEFKPVATRATLALRKTADEMGFQTIMFQEPLQQTAKSNEASQASMKSKDTKKEAENEFDMKKARHEVLNYAMSNQRTMKNKRKMEIFQLVKLGAKPSKKAYKNYNDLKAERHRLSDIREQRKKFHQLGKNQAGAASVKCNSKTKINQTQKKRAPVANIGQHYGKAQPKFKKKH